MSSYYYNFCSLIVFPDNEMGVMLSVAPHDVLSSLPKGQAGML